MKATSKIKGPKSFEPKHLTPKFVINHWRLTLGAVHKLRHLFSDLSRPLPSPLSSCVIFWPTPPTPQPDDVIYERANDTSMKDYFVRRTLTTHGYFWSWSHFWCIWGEWFDFHSSIAMVSVSCGAVSVFFLLPPAPSLSSVIFCQTPFPPLSSFVLAPPTPL